MSKTNSNSITSILVAALNEKSEFRTEMLKTFKNKIKNFCKTKNIKYSLRIKNENIIFYNGTHNPLQYKEMNGKEVDIIARNPGENKPQIMIEVKASANETLQESQAKTKEYQITSEKHNIPLIYLIPQQYNHKNDLPENSIIINWETLMSKTKNLKIAFDNQINHFVEISDTKGFSKNEEELLKNKDLLLNIYSRTNEVKEQIEDALKRYSRKITKRQDNQWGVGFYYTYSPHNQKNEYFIGFNPEASEKNFIALTILENIKINSEQEEQDYPLYFFEGWYYVPIFQEDVVAGDKIVLEKIRKNLKMKKINLNSFTGDFRKNFKVFLSLRTKINNFENIFVKNNKIYSLNEKEYSKITKKIIK